MPCGSPACLKRFPAAKVSDGPIPRSLIWRGRSRPTGVALKHTADWRWLLGRSDSPWYPTMRLFRQEKRDDWRGVFADMARAQQERL